MDMYERNLKPCCTASKMEDLWQLSVAAHSVHLQLPLYLEVAFSICNLKTCHCVVTWAPVNT